MRGDQLGRQWRIIRAIEASPNGLTVAEIAEREETRIRSIYQALEALQAAGFPYPCHAKAQRAPREIFRLLLSFLDIFSASSHPIRKAIKEFSARPPLRSLRLCVRVKRDRDRFPPDLMFRLTKEEKKELVTNCDRFQTLKHSSAFPSAFTEQGVKKVDHYYLFVDAVTKPME